MVNKAKRKIPAKISTTESKLKRANKIMKKLVRDIKKLQHELSQLEQQKLVAKVLTVLGAVAAAVVALFSYFRVSPSKDGGEKPDSDEDQDQGTPGSTGGSESDRQDFTLPIVSAVCVVGAGFLAWTLDLLPTSWFHSESNEDSGSGEHTSHGTKRFQTANIAFYGKIFGALLILVCLVGMFFLCRSSSPSPEEEDGLDLEEEP